MHKELADQDGNVSASRVVERQPSIAEPMQRGMPYTVIVHELSRACPGLMEMLALTGNADHCTARVATTLQLLKRVCAVGSMQLKRLGGDQEKDEEAWAHAEKIVCNGMPAEFKLDVRSYTIGSRQPRSRDRYVLVVAARRRRRREDDETTASNASCARSLYTPCRREALRTSTSCVSGRVASQVAT